MNSVDLVSFGQLSLFSIERRGHNFLLPSKLDGRPTAAPNSTISRMNIVRLPPERHTD
jgi:hypothetical protein